MHPSKCFSFGVNSCTAVMHQLNSLSVRVVVLNVLSFPGWSCSGVPVFLLSIRVLCVNEPKLVEVVHQINSSWFLIRLDL